MKNTTQNSTTPKFTSTVLCDVLFRNEKIIKDIEFHSLRIENWASFSKETGVGKIYRQSQAKVRICKRLLK